MITGQRINGKSRKGNRERFDTRRRRRVNMSGPYIGDQAKLLGSHGGKALDKSCTHDCRRRILEKVIMQEIKNRTELFFDIYDDLSDYFDHDFAMQLDAEPTLDGFTNLEYDFLDYDYCLLEY